MTQTTPGRWRLRVFTGPDPATGHPRQIERHVHGNQRQAQAALTALLAEVGEGRHAGTKSTVNVLLNEWIAHKETVGTRPGTLEPYRNAIKLHIAPRLGRIPLAKLTAHDLDRYYSDRTKAGLAAGTVRVHHAVLSAALGQAVRWGWITANPAQHATPPAKTASPRRAPTSTEVRRLIETCGPDIDLATAVILAAVIGARRGELCGLRWGDVDWDAGTITIERSRSPVGGDHTGTTKTGHTRRVAVGDGVITILAAYRAALADRCARLGVDPDPDGWLLSHDGGRTPYAVKRLSSDVTALGRRAGVPITLHELRHYAATTMIGAGVDVRTAASRLGHTPEMLLRVYAHQLPERDRAAADLLEVGVLPARDEGRPRP